MSTIRGRAVRRAIGALAGVAIGVTLIAGCAGGSGAGAGGDGGGATDEAQPLKIALSNYFNGNIWRKQMEQSFLDTAKENPEYVDGNYKIVNATDGSAPTQAQQIQSLVLEGYDVILIDAASPTGLNGAIQSACDAGVTVVVFDSLATADCAYKVAFDYVQYGIDEAEFMAEQLGGKGNILMVRGIAGNTVDDDIYKGVTETLEKYPEMNLVGEVYGQWTESVAQQEVAKIIPSLPQIDGVLTNGNDGGGTLDAFLQANYNPLPLIIQGNSGQGLQGWQKVLETNPDYETMSVSTQPSISSAALWLSVLVRNGMDDAADVPDKTIYVPLLEIPEDNLDAWASYLGYTDIAMNPISLEDTQAYVKSALDGNPILVDTPAPPSK